MMSRFYCLGACLLALLSACASTPVHYYTLSSPPSTVQQTTPPDFVLDVLPVGMPVQLDQPQLVVRQGATDVMVLDTERWLSAMNEEVRNALSAALTAQLGTQDVAGLPHPSSVPVVKVKLQVRRLDAWLGQQVQLDADWSLELAKKDGGAHKVCQTHVNVPAQGGYPELVLAQQRAIAVLAGQMAVQARALRGPQTPCGPGPA